MSSKVLTGILAAVVIVIATFMVLRNGERLPNGIYDPIDEISKITYQRVEVKGNNFTIVMGGIVPLSTTLKYKYKDGTITFISGMGSGVNVACTYKNGILNYGGAEFKKNSLQFIFPVAFTGKTIFAERAG